MGVPSFFRQNKPKEFKYVPRYYDAEKEEREERNRRIREELGMPEEGGGKSSGIKKGSFGPKFRTKDEKMQQYTSVRLIIIVLVLFLITYVFWKL
ncbi:MAG: hypothetical protein FJY11_04965 [Bacteroidetes bacterium]|nr:hypothetical protein [Bacteroidota bacterium]